VADNEVVGFWFVDSKSIDVDLFHAASLSERPYGVFFRGLAINFARMAKGIYGG
jgi:hypothetical protein